MLGLLGILSVKVFGFDGNVRVVYSLRVLGLLFGGVGLLRIVQG